MQKRLQDVLNKKGDNYILPFYWQHGESAELLIEGMEKIKESGIHAVCVEARPHPDFVGEMWWRDMDIILAKAHELDMKVWILDDAHFPTGRCNNLITNDSPYIKVLLKHYCIDAIGPLKNASFIVSLAEREEFIAAVAARRHPEKDYYMTDVQDITHLLRGDVIEWDVPEGVWEVIIIKTTYTHTARQNYANLIDRDAVKFLIDTVYEPHFDKYSQHFGNTISGFFSDEPEIGNTFKDFRTSYAGVPEIPLPWCSELKDYLMELWQENFATNLMTLWNDIDYNFDDTNNSGIIRGEYVDAVTRLYQRNFCEQLGDWCRAHNVEYIGHVIEGGKFGNGVGHFFRGLWGQDMAGIDLVLQQTRPGFDEISFHRVNSLGAVGSPMPHFALARLGSSLAHIDPKKKGRALCENFGAYGWAEGVKMMKWLNDHMMVRGINYFVPHAFTMKDFPDPDCPPHFYARGNNPQYPYFGLLMEYTNRVCHLISGGVHCSDVALLYTADLEWIQPEQAVMEFPLPAKKLTQAQVDFDIVPLDVVYDSELTDGCLLTGAPVYDSDVLIGQEKITTLVIPECGCIEAKLARWCETAILTGLNIICVNKLPKILSTDGAVSEWTGNTPKVSPLDGLGECVRDISGESNITKPDTYLRNYHYKHADGEYYLLFNEAVSYDINTTLAIEVQDGDAVYIYDAWNNKMLSTEYDANKGELNLDIVPYEMKIVYVGKLTEQQVCHMLTKITSTTELKADWKLYLKNAIDSEFVQYRELSEFINVTAYEHKQNFCGIMKYITEIEITNPDNWTYIDFGEVYETAKLWINDTLVGSLITPPYKFDIRGLLQKGNNKITLEVSNTPVYKNRDRFSVFMPIEPSGLIGPVLLISAK